ncbi:SGNH/GDSL hydrolase family protein [Carboxylicivirga taeanensis]|uniref:SGNH/GDSL hydrolase family protein n=1 Tax=Carboxylicivirga taeanensis TaxID=1416875 RepID=UPI003F6E0559
MIKRTIYQYMLLMAVALFAACEPSVDEFKPSSGTADFSKFIAIGDSYTAGYTDGALGRRGQEESFSYILGQQLMYAGSESFNQPLVQSEGSVGTTVLAENQNNSYFELKVVNGAFKPVPGLGDMGIFAEDAYSADNQNFGIPGAKVIHMGELPEPYPAYPHLNKFFARFASSMEATVLGDALATKPTFVSLWLGNNDLLTYALAGGESDEITNPLVYAGALSNIIDAIQAGGADIVIANIPAIEAIPFFNTVPYNALPLDQATAGVLNGAYATYNAAADANGLPRIEFKEGANALVIEDDDFLLNGIRQIKEGEKFLLNLPTDKIKTEGWGTQVPIPDEYVLDATELKAIEDARLAYNASIAALAKEKNLALADLATLMDAASTTGLLIDGNRYTSGFVSGGLFSLDGIHATGRGSAIIANAFIDAINKQFEAAVPRANINDYNLVELP